MCSAILLIACWKMKFVTSHFYLYELVVVKAQNYTHSGKQSQAFQNTGLGIRTPASLNTEDYPLSNKTQNYIPPRTSASGTSTRKTTTKKRQECSLQQTTEKYVVLILNFNF
jgi:long-subunit fatty acid transport protein